MRKAFWLYSSLLQWLVSICCVKAKSDFYAVANAKLAHDTTNCTSYIPTEWRLLMQEHEPELSNNEEKPVVPEEFLLACLHEALRNKNETSPFSFIQHNYIRYNIAINEVMSLSHDGTLFTKARIFSNFTSIEKNN